MQKIFFCVVVIFFMSMTNVFAGDKNNIKLIINGLELGNLSANPTIIDDSVVVPVRDVLENFNTFFDWKNDTRELFITKDDKIVLLKLGDRKANVNGEEKILSTPPIILNNKLMIPVRFVAENFGFYVKWKNNCVIINSAAEQPVITQVDQSEIKPIKISEPLITENNLISPSAVNLPELKNISSTNNIIKISRNNLDLNQIIQNDLYCDKKYELIFPLDFDFENTFDISKNGQYLIQNSYFDSVYGKIEKAKYKKLIINAKEIFAYDLTQDENNIYIKAIAPKEKYKKILVIDAGHGGVDQGTSNNNIHEKDLTFDITKKIMDLFNNDEQIKVYSTRLSDAKIPLETRISMANKIADMFVSVHINSAPNPTANGVEVYYYNDNSKNLAETLHKNLLTSLSANDRKVRKSGFYVVKNATIPASLCEIGFITNPDEFINLCSEVYRQKAAQAIYNSIKSLLLN